MRDYTEYGTLSVAVAVSWLSKVTTVTNCYLQVKLTKCSYTRGCRHLTVSSVCAILSSVLLFISR